MSTATPLQEAVVNAEYLKNLGWNRETAAKFMTSTTTMSADAKVHIPAATDYAWDGKPLPAEKTYEPSGIPTTLDTVEYADVDENLSDPFTEEGAATADRIIAAKQRKQAAAAQPDKAEIARAFQLLKQPGDAVELRCPKTDKGTVLGLYTDGNELVNDTYDLSCGTSVKTGNVYWTLQGVKPTECANGFNTFAKRGEGVTDEMVAEYRWLPIDFDPVRQSGNQDSCSTDSEKAAAYEVAVKVREFLKTMGINSILADSGNGYHALVKISLPANTENEQLVSALLDGFSAKFKTSAVSVDTGVYNPSRIWKVYGTVARKGEHTVERPYRVAHVLDAPALAVVSEAKLREVLATLPTNAGAKSVKGASDTSTTFNPTFKEYPRTADGKVAIGSRRQALLSHFGTLRNHGYDEDRLVEECVAWARDHYELNGDEFSEERVAKTVEYFLGVYGVGENKWLKFTMKPDATPPASAPPPPAQAEANAAEEASQGATGSFPEGFAKPTDAIPVFDESMLVGVIRKLTDALCAGTTIPRQYGAHVAKTMLSAILTKFKIRVEGCASTRSYFITFGETGTGKGEIYRRMMKILECFFGRFVRFVYTTDTLDSEAGMRDALMDIPEGEDNCPLLYFVDEVLTLGQKADGKKNPEIIGGIVEMADKTTVSRAKAKKGKGNALKTKNDAWLMLYACAQDGEAFATAFPRTKKQGFPDRFIPEYSGKVDAGNLPEPNFALGMEAISEAITFARALQKGMSMSSDVRDQVETIWNSQPDEFRKSPRLRQQFLLELYLATFARGSAIAEAQDLAVAVKWFERQKPIRAVFFSEEIPDTVGVYIQRLRKVFEEMLRTLRKGTYLGEVAQSFRDLATTCLAYKDNDLVAFKRAWDAMIPFMVEIQVTAANGHVYDKVVPMPAETDTWLPGEYKLIHPRRNQ